MPCKMVHACYPALARTSPFLTLLPILEEREMPRLPKGKKYLNLYLPEKTVSALKIYSQRYECSLGYLVDLCVRIVLGHSESAKRALKYDQDRYERSQASEEEWQDLSHELNHEIKEFASHLTEEEEWQDLNHEPEESGRQTTGETETAAPSPEPAEQPRATEEPETPQESTEEPSEPDTSAAAPEAHEEPSPAAEPPARPAQPKPNPFFADALARLKSLQEMREARNQRERAAQEAAERVRKQSRKKPETPTA